MNDFKDGTLALYAARLTEATRERKRLAVEASDILTKLRDAVEYEEKWRAMLAAELPMRTNLEQWGSLRGAGCDPQAAADAVNGKGTVA